MTSVPSPLHTFDENINGGRNSLRKVQVKQLIECNKVDILLLQETHSTDSSSAEWELFLKGHWFFSSLSSPIAGIAIYFQQTLPLTLVSFKEIVKGYLASLTFSIHQQLFTIVNLYAPSTNPERSSFFDCLKSFLANIPPDHFLCLGGDFNCTLNPPLDRNGAEPHAASTRALARSISKFKLTDIWRLQHPTQQQFTWCSCF